LLDLATSYDARLDIPARKSTLGIPGSIIEALVPATQDTNAD